MQIQRVQQVQNRQNIQNKKSVKSNTMFKGFPTDTLKDKVLESGYKKAFELIVTMDDLSALEKALNLLRKRVDNVKEKVGLFMSHTDKDTVLDCFQHDTRKLFSYHNDDLYIEFPYSPKDISLNFNQNETPTIITFSNNSIVGNYPIKVNSAEKAREIEQYIDCSGLNKSSTTFFNSKATSSSLEWFEDFVQYLYSHFKPTDIDRELIKAGERRLTLADSKDSAYINETKSRLAQYNNECNERENNLPEGLFSDNSLYAQRLEYQNTISQNIDKEHPSIIFKIDEFLNKTVNEHYSLDLCDWDLEYLRFAWSTLLSDLDSKIKELPAIKFDLLNKYFPEMSKYSNQIAGKNEVKGKPTKNKSSEEQGSRMTAWKRFLIKIGIKQNNKSFQSR